VKESPPQKVLMKEEGTDEAGREMFPFLGERGKRLPTGWPLSGSYYEQHIKIKGGEKKGWL